MKHVQIVAFCDGDHEDGDNVPAVVERTLGLDGEERVLDLCEACDTIIVQNMLLVLLDRGAKVEDQPKHRPRRRAGAGKPTTCPDCGMTSTTREALGQHTRKQHGKKLVEYDWTEAS